MTWQGKAGQGFDLDSFAIDWDAHQVTCLQEHRSARWKPDIGRTGYPQNNVIFAQQHCMPCPVRKRRTRSKTEARKLALGPREEHRGHDRTSLRQEAQGSDPSPSTGGPHAPKTPSAHPV